MRKNSKGLKSKLIMPTIEYKNSTTKEESAIELLVIYKREEPVKYSNGKIHTFLNTLIDKKIKKDIIAAIIN